MFLAMLLPVGVAVAVAFFFSLHQAEKSERLEVELQEIAVAWRLSQVYPYVLVDAALAKSIIKGASYDTYKSWHEPLLQERSHFLSSIEQEVIQLGEGSDLREIGDELCKNYRKLLSSLSPAQIESLNLAEFSTSAKNIANATLKLSNWFESSQNNIDFQVLFAEKSVRQFNARLKASIEIRKAGEVNHKELFKIMGSAPSPAAKGLQSAQALLSDNQELIQLIEDIKESKKRLVPNMPTTSFDYFSYSHESEWLGDAMAISQSATNIVNSLQQQMSGNKAAEAARARQLLVNSIWQSALFILITVSMTTWISLSVTKPMARIAKAAEAMSEGRMSDVEIGKDIKRKDEIGEVSRAFDQLRSNMDAFGEEIEGVQASILKGSPHVEARKERFQGRWGTLVGDMNRALDQFKSVNTSKLEAERVAQESQRRSLVGKMAGGMAHDFNNLLAVIIGFAEIAESDAVGENKKPLREILTAGQKARDLVSRIMAIGRQSELNIQTHRLHGMITADEESLRSILPSNIDLSYRIDERACIMTDSTSFSQIILNLVVNARDAMPDGGQLTLMSKGVEVTEVCKTILEDDVNPGQYWCLAVMDQGTGIPEEQHAKIFEPFYTTKQVTEGTGLGLAMVYSIMLELGGWVDVHSEMGQGSSFLLYFPVGDAENIAEKKQVVHHTTKEADEDNDKASLRILLVDDEHQVRQFTKAALRKLGHEVIESDDGVNGFNTFKGIMDRGERLDAVVTDVMMPNATGPEMVDEIRKLNASIPVLFISGFSADKLKDLDAKYSGVSSLKKPFQVSDLQGGIDAAFEKALKSVVDSEAIPVNGEHAADTMKVLLVDDDVQVRTFTKAALQKLGHEVIEAEDGVEGYDSFKNMMDGQSDPDVIVTDVMMPKATGPEMVDKIQEVDSSIPVVFISGFSADKLKDLDDKYVGASSLKKPFMVSDLQGGIDAAMEKSKKAAIE